MTRKPPADGLGERIRKARLAAGYEHQTDLAAALGLKGPNTVNRWETAGGAISKGYLRKLAQKLHVSESWLLYGLSAADEAVQKQTSLHVVEAYLASDIGRDCPKQVEALLRGFDFRTLGVMRPTVKHVHRLRDLLETLRLVDKMSGDGQDERLRTDR